MISIVSIFFTVLGLVALLRKDKIPAWSLIAVGNGLALVDSVRRNDGIGVGFSAAGLAVCAAWLVVLVLGRRKAA